MNVSKKQPSQTPEPSTTAEEVSADQQSEFSQVQPESVEGQLASVPMKTSAHVLWWFVWLLSVAAVAGGAYWFYQQQQALQARLTAATALLNQQVDQANALQNQWDERLLAVQNNYDKYQQNLQEKLGQTVDGLRQQLDQQQQQQEVLQQAVSDIHEIAMRSEREWKLAEAEFLTKTALGRLHLVRDIDGAISALQEADLRLHELSDPALLPVREAYATAITQLQLFQRPDLEGLALQLEKMMNAIGRLPLKSVDKPENDVLEVEPKPSSDQTWYQRWLGEVASWFTIRRNNRPVHTLASLDEIKLHDQSLYTALLGSKLSLLRQDEAQLQRYSSQAVMILQQHYDQAQTSTQAMLDNLIKLKSTPIQPELPDVSLCLLKLKEFRQASRVKEQTVQ